MCVYIYTCVEHVYIYTCIYIRTLTYIYMPMQSPQHPPRIPKQHASVAAARTAQLLASTSGWRALRQPASLLGLPGRAIAHVYSIYIYVYIYVYTEMHGCSVFNFIQMEYISIVYMAERERDRYMCIYIHLYIPGQATKT